MMGYGQDAVWAGPGALRHRVRVENSRINWVEAGSGSPLILLHGYGGSARWWTRNMAALGRVRRTYALDLPGFGRSRLSGRFTFERTADLIASWMGERGMGGADMVAHSMGGQLATILAARHPGLVRSLVLTAPAGIPFETGLPGIALRAFKSRRGGDPKFTPIVVGGVMRAGPRILWQAVQQIRFIDVREHLGSITAPTLILWGDGDGLLTSDNAPVLAAALPTARLHMVPGGRHNLMWEQAEIFNEVVTDFLAAQPAWSR